MKSSVLYLIDTNIIVAYVRRNQLYQMIENRYSLLSRLPKPVISVVTEGEIRALTVEFGWGAGKQVVLENLLAYFDILPVLSDSTGNNRIAKIVENYVQVAEQSRLAGKTMGKNDLWIAATTISVGATLLTTDKDFDHLMSLLTHDWIDPTL